VRTDILAFLGALGWVAFFHATVRAEEPWHGFPVYPPEAARTLEPQGGRTAVPGLESCLAAFRAFDRDNEVAHSFREKPLEEAFEEYEIASLYLLENAPRLGWTLFDEYGYRDGGSQVWKFGRLDDKLRLVTVTLWSAISTSGGGREAASVHLRPDFGKIDYEYEAHEPPGSLEGFPACLREVSKDSFSVALVPDGTRFTIPEDQCIDPQRNIKLWRIPFLAGWETHGSYHPFVGEGPGCWKRDGRVLLTEALPGGLRAFTFVEPARAPAVLERFRDRVEREVVVPEGCIVLNGRYLRLPIRLRVDGERITANGELVELLASSRPPDVGNPFGSRADPLGRHHAFHMHLSRERSRSIVVSSGIWGVGEDLSARCGCRGWLEAIDRAVRSPGDRAAKIEALRALPLLEGSSEKSLSEILERWDGID